MELNQKLAEWAGFKEINCKPPYTVLFLWWLSPKKDRLDKLPDFTTSLDACFKWLVPKLENTHSWIFGKNINGFAMTIWSKADVVIIITGEADTPALALCKAIERLIDASPRKE